MYKLLLVFFFVGKMFILKRKGNVSQYMTYVVLTHEVEVKSFVVDESVTQCYGGSPRSTAFSLSVFHHAP